MINANIQLSQMIENQTGSAGEMTTLQESLEILRVNDTTSFFSLNSQSAHRLKVFQSWLKIARVNGYELDPNIVGKSTLDIGCGQGDMIALFAAALKVQGNKESRVIGIDPARLDYGAPSTLGEAQLNISTGPLHDYLCFKQTTASELVKSYPKETYTTAYFAHSLYYFPSSAALIQDFKALLDAGLKTLLLAEWSLSISRQTALPHLLAVLLQSIDPLPEGNVRTVLSPAAYVDAAIQAGWEVVGSNTFTPATELEDGKWETRIARLIANKGDIEEHKRQAINERNAESVRFQSIRAHSDALEGSIISQAEMNGVECMNVWTAIFRHPNQVEGVSVS